MPKERWPLMKPLPSLNYLTECFDYGPKSGSLKWRSRPLEHFASLAAQQRFNRLYARKEVRGHNRAGYSTVTINCTRYMSHRICFVLTHGIDPGAMKIDHINGDNSDNSSSNLRLATDTQNASNRHRFNKNRSSGIRGVTFHGNRWVAYVYVNSQQIVLGRFVDRMEAKRVADAARRAMYGEYSGAL